VKRDRVKRCPTCGETDLANFHRNAGQMDGLQVQCKVCHRTQVARSRAKKCGQPLPEFPPRQSPPVDAAPKPVPAPVVVVEAPPAPAPKPRAKRCGCGTDLAPACGFPMTATEDCEGICGERICTHHGHSIRPGLTYCTPHYERAQEALSRRNSCR